MIANLKNYQDFAYIFVIKNVSRLLIYKENWTKSTVMRKVIPELLKTGVFSKVYVGSKPEKYECNLNPDCYDCAVVHIKIHGIDLLDYEPKDAEELFVKEIKNEKNIFQFESNWINAEENTTIIDFDIRIPNTAKKTKIEKNAA